MIPNQFPPFNFGLGETAAGTGFFHQEPAQHPAFGTLAGADAGIAIFANFQYFDRLAAWQHTKDLVLYASPGA